MGKGLITKEQLKSVENAAKSKSYDYILTADGWMEESGNYAIVLLIEGIDADTNGVLSVSKGAKTSQYMAAANALIAVTAQEKDALTLTAYGEKPERDIPVTVLVFA